MGNSSIKDDPREQKRRNNQLSICERKTMHGQNPITSHSPLFFHPYTKGSQTELDSSNQCAWRKSGFCNGITFTNRPILIQEEVRVKITKTDITWSGALRLGCTIFNPSLMDPNALPKFICPDLEDVYGFWAKALPEALIQEGAIISFWVNKRGFFMYRVNRGREYLLMKGLLMDHPLWMMVDVYGMTRGVQLLDPRMKSVSQNKSPEWPSVAVRSDELQTLQTQAPVFSAITNNGHSEPSPCISKPLANNHPQSSKSLDEDCVLCFSHRVNSVLYKCGHMCMCYGCGQKLLSRKLTCPICRQPIKEIIKTFRS